MSTTAEVRAAVLRQLHDGNEFIKLIASGGGLTPNTDPAAADLAQPLMSEAVGVAHAQGAAVASHCHATESMERALVAGVDVIEHASFVTRDGHRFDGAIACRLRSAGIVVDPTVVGALRSAAEIRRAGQSANPAAVSAIARLEGRLTNAARYRELGLKIVAGTDAGVTATGFDSLVDELLAYQSVGFSAAEALRAATCDAAEFLALGERGQVRVGWQADLVLLENDPLLDLETLRRPALVMKAGRVVVASEHARRWQSDVAPAPRWRNMEPTAMSHRLEPGPVAPPTERALEIRSPRGREEMEQYYDLRWRILRAPWAQGRGGERDEHEEEAFHVAAWAGGRIVGVGRLHFTAPHEAQIRYMAVESELQGRGIGGRILAELEQCARAAGAGKIVLNARDRAVEFYRQHGYRVMRPSEVLFDAIPHWQMEKAL